jgi:DNA-binding MarR family transcriptional regulator
MAATPTTSDATLSDRELRAWKGFLRAHTAMTKALDAQMDAEHGLPLTSYEVLFHVADSSGERMRMCDLATSVLLSRSGLTRLVDRLERDGLIVRESCADDARGQFAVITEDGRAKLEAARATHRASIRALFLDHFTADELDVLGDAWERVLPGAQQAAGRRCGC